MKFEKSSNDKRQYFIAVIPDEALQKEITRLKNHMAENYNSKNALKSPPHITLVPPFHFEEERENEMIRTLSLICQSKSPFYVNLDGFGSFKPKVIYVNVEENEVLEVINNDLLHWVEEYLGLDIHREKNRKFKPHMTIASRDLKKPAYFRAWREFENQEISHSFLVDAIYILVHNGKSWDILKKVGFGASPGLNP